MRCMATAYTHLIWSDIPRPNTNLFGGISSSHGDYKARRHRRLPDAPPPHTTKDTILYETNSRRRRESGPPSSHHPSGEKNQLQILILHITFPASSLTSVLLRIQPPPPPPSPPLHIPSVPPGYYSTCSLQSSYS